MVLALECMELGATKQINRGIAVFVLCQGRMDRRVDVVNYFFIVKYGTILAYHNTSYMVYKWYYTVSVIPKVA